MIDAAIEQAARRLGVHADSLPPGGGWRITRLAWVPGQGEWTAWFSFGLGDTRGVPDARLDAPTAALFLLLLGLPEVAVTCPDCKARSATKGKLARWVWMAYRALNFEYPGWQTSVIESPGARDMYALTHCIRPCPTCTIDGKPLGQVQREPARLLLDAMPRVCKECEGHGCLTEYDDGTRVPGPGWSSGERIDCTGCPAPGGDPAAREALAAFADQLQAHGDQRGTWVSLWLAGPEAFAQLLGEVDAALVELAKCPGMAPGEYEGLDVHVPCVGGWLDERVIFAVGRSCPKCRAVHGLRVAVNSTPYQHAMVGLRLAESWIDDYLEPERD